MLALEPAARKKAQNPIDVGRQGADIDPARLGGIALGKRAGDRLGLIPELMRIFEVARVIIVGRLTGGGLERRLPVNLELVEVAVRAADETMEMWIIAAGVDVQARRVVVVEWAQNLAAGVFVGKSVEAVRGMTIAVGATVAPRRFRRRSFGRGIAESSGPFPWWCLIALWRFGRRF